MKVLIIEDNVDAVRGICDYIEEKEWDCELCGFKDSRDRIAVTNPELVIMDWMYDAESVDEGDPIFKEIYENNFIPVIIFSAVAHTINLPEYMTNTPLIKIVSKGDEQIVIDLIEEWENYILAVKGLRVELNKSLVSSIKAIDNFIQMDDYPGDEVVKHMLNKRVTYYFDKDYIESNMPAWVQYEYPPIQESLLVADVLRKNLGSQDLNKCGAPEEYRVVLTPSCDMARANEDQEILVASCQSADSFIDIKLKKGEDISSDGAIEKKDKIIRALHTGYNYAKVALPILPNKIPYMTINLKKIELVRIGDIALDEESIGNRKYYRVASTVSPYREQIVWAHMINSCRPGMPDRNMNEWAEGILLS